ncbi:hypothetical protein ACWF62_02360 [Rhodococcus sp. NPDC054953]
MSVTDSTPSGVPTTADVTRIAARVWRRAGVRRSDRAGLLDELSGELEAADSAGLGADAVVGSDPAATLRSWADERGLSGRATRLGLVALATLAGATLGMGTTLTMLYLGFWRNVTVEPAQLIGVIFAASGALGYLLALACTWGTLRAVGDPRAADTTRALARILPIAALFAILAGVGTAWAQGFTTLPSTFATTIVAVCAMVGAGAAIARHIGLRPRVD